MKTVIVFISALLLLELVSGLYIRNTQNLSHTQANLNTGVLEREEDGDITKTDVYELEEDKNTIRLKYPKADKPVVREIIYYHVIETPYDDQGSKKLQEEGPDFDQTRRPFTNSHGFQFLLEDPEKNDDSVNKIVGNANVTEGDGIDDDYEEDTSTSSIEDEENEKGVDLEQKDSEEAVTTEIIEIDEDDDDVEEEVNPVENTKETKKSEQDGEKQEEMVSDDDDDDDDDDDPEIATKVTDEKEQKTGAEAEDASATAKSGDVVVEKKNARNLLFSQAKNKYQTKRNQNSAHKSKREVSFEDLPPAPTLHPLNLDMLPDYVRELISSPEPDTTTASPPKHDLSHFNEDDFKEELEEKIQDIINSFKPKDDGDDEDSDQEDGDQEDSDQEDSDQEDGSDEYESDDYDEEDDDIKYSLAPRTYGLNLTMGRGYVWNDLISNPGTPGMSFDVGDSEDRKQQPEKQKESSEDHEKTERPEVTPTTPKSEQFPIFPHPTETKPIHFENPVTTEATHTILNNHEETTHDDLEDIEITQRPKLLEETSSENRKPDARNDNNDDFKTKKATGDNDKDKKQHRHEKVKGKKEKEGKDEKESHPSNKNEAPDFIKDLMNNEQFWNWLGDWTATYMELLLKHIKNIVHDEVSRQMKKYKKELKLEQREDQDKKEETILKEHEIKEDQKKKNESAFERNEPSNKNICKGENNNEVKQEKNENKLIVDGKEIPLTHTTNFGQENGNFSQNKKSKDPEEQSNDTAVLRHKKDKEDNKRPEALHKESKKNSPTRITANNIFGNAPNSNVTNIFIFYPPNNDVLQNLSPNNENHNVFAFPNEVTVDQRHPDYTDKKESASTEKPAEIFDNKSEIPEDTGSVDKKDSQKQKDQESHTTQESDSKPTDTTTLKPNSKIPIEDTHLNEKIEDITQKPELTSQKDSQTQIGQESGTTEANDLKATDTTTLKPNSGIPKGETHTNEKTENKPELTSEKDNKTQTDKESQTTQNDLITTDTTTLKPNSEIPKEETHVEEETENKPELSTQTTHNNLGTVEITTVKSKDINESNNGTKNDEINNSDDEHKTTSTNTQEQNDRSTEVTENPQQNELNDNLDKKTESIDGNELKEKDDSLDKDAVITNDSLKDKEIDKVVLKA